MNGKELDLQDMPDTLDKKMRLYQIWGAVQQPKFVLVTSDHGLSFFIRRIKHILLILFSFLLTFENYSKLAHHVYLINLN